MRRRTNNKRRMDVILVAGAATLPAAGALVDATTSFTIADGEIGVLSADVDGTRPAGEFLADGELPSAHAYSVKFVQGTPFSSQIHLADPWEAGHKALVEGDRIFADSIRAFRADAPVTPASNTVVMDLRDMILLDDAEHKLQIQLNSVRNDRDYGDNDEAVHAIFETPDNTALGTVNPLDQIVQNLVYDIMVQSKAVSSLSNRLNKGNRNVIAFAVAHDVPADAQFQPTVITDIAVGDVIPILRDEDGNVINFVATKDFVKTLAKTLPETTLDTGDQIVMVDLSLAGTLAAGADGILFMGLDEDLPRAFDNIVQVKTSINVEASGALTQTTNRPTAPQDGCAPVEAENSGRAWRIQYERRAAGTIFSLENNRMSDYLITPPTYFNVDSDYYAYIIEHFGREETLTTEERNPMRTVLLLEADCTADIGATVGAMFIRPVIDFDYVPVLTGLPGLLDTRIGPWLDAADNAFPFSKAGDGDFTAPDHVTPTPGVWFAI